MRLLVLVLGAALALSGCGTEFVSNPPRAAAPMPTYDPALDDEPDPVAITIPKLDVTSTLVPLGLNEDGGLAVPPVEEPEQAGWYAGARPDVDGDEWKPGENGPAVIAGHVDGLHPDGRKGKPGVFARLSELAPGDEVLVEQATGEELRYLVAAVERVPKAKFPWDRVMAEDGRPTLQLITCGGEFNRDTGHYEDNWVVFTVLAP
ncbi:MAG TPA: sortase [Thermobifida alba]|nr:sortase [Thermobifida alba]